MRITIALLIIGAVLMTIGIVQAVAYEADALTVTATVTDIETTDDTDDGPISYKHVYYGDYTVDGQTYTNQQLKTAYTSSAMPDILCGDTIEIEVDAKDPSKKIPDGGPKFMGGAFALVWGAVRLFSTRKAKKATLEAQ